MLACTALSPLLLCVCLVPWVLPHWIVLCSTPSSTVFNECVEGGKISPQTCIYFDQWLDF